MKVKELQNGSRRQSGKFSISEEEQKEKRSHAWLVISPIELEDLRRVSSHVYGFLKEKPGDNNYAFPDLSRKDQKLSSSMFNKMFKMVSSQCFSQPLTVTDIRKLITREISGQSKQTQEAVARAEDHFVAIAEKFYNVTNPADLVEKAGEHS